MSYNPNNPNGQATMANSEPVVIASDQSAIPASLAAGTNNIGDVDVLTVNGVAPAFGSGVRGATVQRVTIATDDVVPVTDNGSSLTVDNNGTFPVQAAQSGTWNVNNVSGTVSLPTGASTLAEQQTQTTALQLLDDGMATVASAIPTKGMAAVGTDGTNARILRTDTNGELQVDVLSLPAVDTELPAPATLADATANPSTTTVSTMPLNFNGTTWDRQRAVTNGMNTTGTGVLATGIVGQLDDTATGAVTENQFAPVRISTRRALLVEGVASGTNMNTNIAQMNGVAVTMGNGVSGTGVQRVSIASDSTGNIATIGTSVVPGTSATHLGKAEDAVHASGDTGVFVLGRRIDTAAASSGTSGDYEAHNMSAEGALWVTATPTTTSGLDVANFNTGDTYTALTNTAQVIKASAGNLYGYYIFNPNTSTAYVMVYNVAAASVTVGTTTARMVFAIPAGAAANLMFTYPISFSTAMSCAAATTGGGNVAPTTALDVMIWYK